MTVPKSAKHKFYLLITIALLVAIFIIGIALGLGVSFLDNA